jgi:DNA-binding NarL/FixJ family response regulator
LTDTPEKKAVEEERCCSGEEKRKKQNSEERKHQAGKGSKKLTPREVTVYKTVGKGKEKREKICRKSFKYNDLSSDQEENILCCVL